MHWQQDRLEISDIRLSWCKCAHTLALASCTVTDESSGQGASQITDCVVIRKRRRWGWWRRDGGQVALYSQCEEAVWNQFIQSRDSRFTVYNAKQRVSLTGCPYSMNILKICKNGQQIRPGFMNENETEWLIVNHGGRLSLGVPRPPPNGSLPDRPVPLLYIFILGNAEYIGGDWSFIGSSV